MAVYVLIPARFHSTRLEGKLLLDLNGQPVLQYTYEKGLASGVGNVIIATDDERIDNAAKAFGAETVMTAVEHQSGTERIAEAVDKLALADDDIVVNLQGDEPFMCPALIQQVVDNLKNNPAASMATLCEVMSDKNEIFSSHNVKVMFDQQGYAVCFSRAVIPWYRDGFVGNQAEYKLPNDFDYYRHIGLYAYTARFIKQYVAWPACQWGQIEALEQMRVLWQGKKIHVAVAHGSAGIGIDSQEDLDKARALMKSA